MNNRAQSHIAFAALRQPGYGMFFVGNAIVMMADNAEHVGSTTLEEIRHLARLSLTGRVAAGAALAPGLHTDARADVKSTGAGGTQ